MTRGELGQLSAAELIAILLQQQAQIEAQQAQIEAQQAIIARLEAQVAEQQGTIAQLQGQVQELQVRFREPAKTPANSPVPPAKGRKANRAAGKAAAKRGPLAGHSGRGREREETDVVIECRPTVCEQCGADLREEEGEQVGSSQVVELPPVEPVVVEAHRYAVECPGWGHCTVADYPAGLEPERVFGTQIEALVSYFHQVHHLSYARLGEVRREVFGLEMSPGALVNSVRRVGEELAARGQEIRAEVRESAVVGSDETGARVNGRNEWEWVFTTAQVSYHVIVPSRASTVMDEVLGEAKPEVWVSDLFSAQLKNPAPQQ